ncbi:hypothetical protein ACSBR2_011620 [Camellia fascicularis]|uniref:Uncharacterized protein n=1 Tax=Camellia lanceoleosa TaxID=1840588 RepID=A0ACC0HC54_9ERIC|nr:hypothetical protein LOK49_LG06G00854 [Camellia lanceoleosa]
MRKSLVFLTFLPLFVISVLQFQAHAAPAGPLIKHLSSILKWTRSASKTPHSDGNVLQFENGYLVETVVDGNELGVVPYKIRVSEDGELYAVDEVNSNIVRITPPLSRYSRARLIAGSFQGYTGHVDGKPIDARFNHPKGVTMDDKGNLYVADTSNFAIRKIGEGGVTTIAGGKSNVAGYRDGPSEGAMFSTDFDVIYVRPTCSLLVIDRGNAALRQISLNQDDCDYQNSSISATDVFMVIGAVLIGYTSCMLQQGFGPSFSSKVQKHPPESEYQDYLSNEKPTPVVEPVKEEQEAGWPSFGRLIIDLSKLALEALASVFFYFIPFRSKSKGSKGVLTPLKNSLIMPEDEAEPKAPVVQKQRTPTPLSETRQAHTPIAGDKYSEMKAPKMRSTSFKDPSLSSKHRSSRRQEHEEFYGSGEVPPFGQHRSKSQKERTKHRQRDKNGEIVYGAVGVEQKPKPVETRTVNYDDPKFDHYSMRNKYGNSFRYD